MSIPDQLLIALTGDMPVRSLCASTRKIVEEVLRIRGWGAPNLEDVVTSLATQLPTWTKEDRVIDKAAHVFNAVRALENDGTAESAAAAVLQLWNFQNATRQSKGKRDPAYEVAKRLFHERTGWAKKDREPTALHVLSLLQKTREGKKWRVDPARPNFDPEETFPIEFSRWKKLFALDLFK